MDTVLFNICHVSLYVMAYGNVGCFQGLFIEYVGMKRKKNKYQSFIKKIILIEF